MRDQSYKAKEQETKGGGLFFMARRKLLSKIFLLIFTQTPPPAQKKTQIGFLPLIETIIHWEVAESYSTQEARLCSSASCLSDVTFTKHCLWTAPSQKQQDWSLTESVLCFYNFACLYCSTRCSIYYSGI